MKLYGRTQKVVTETIRICKDRDVLKAGKMSVEEIASYFFELSVEDIREIEKEMLETM